jgi:lipoprotein-releasing system permease protein
MYKPLALFIGLRYTRTRKKNHLISFVSVVSMLGITLGVLALIAVLSVINGSTSTMREETLKAVPHASIRTGSDQQWQDLLVALRRQPGILGAAPYIEGEAWLRFDGRAEFVQLRGVSPDYESDVTAADSFSMNTLLPELAPGISGIILGTQLAARLGLYTGDQASVTPLSSLVNAQLEDARTFRVLGIADFGFYGNNDNAIIHLDDAERMFGGAGAHAVQLRLRVDDVFNAGSISRAALQGVASEQGPGINANAISTWQETQGGLFDALRLEKTLTGFMLLMIVVIGAVNIISTLVMVVADKSADIAILRTMGAGKGSIMAIFITQGAAVGIFGTALGAILGILLAANIDNFTRWLENFLNAGFQDGNVYMISHLRAELHWSDVLLVSLSAIIVSFVATLYPAYRASRIQPAEVLRYE